MKLVSFGKRGFERPGVVVEDQILDLGLATEGRVRSIRELLEAGEAGLSGVQGIIDQGPRGEWLVPISEQRLGPPVTNPTKIIGIGLNYRCHATEQNAKLPKRPLLFSKATTSLAGDGDPICFPVTDGDIDYEAELGVVIGRTAHRVKAEDWRDHVVGYTIVNDVSGREAQFGDRQWFRGKSYDTFCPMGPYLVTAEEVPDPHKLAIAAILNGEVRQQSNTDDLIFDLPALLADATADVTLLPGDVVATGTPSGVGVFMEPKACMEPGDEIVIEIEQLGRLRNPVVGEPTAGPSPYPHPRS